MDNPNPEIILVTNSVHPYHLHNVSILSLPFGGTYHFRYEHRYFQLDSSEIADLQGKMGLLVLRDFERATFVPLRSFRVLAVDDCGEFVFLDLQFLHFVEYAASRSETDVASMEQVGLMRADRERYSSAVAPQLDALKIGNNPNQHLDKLILSARSADLARVPLTQATEGGMFTQAWSRVVTALGGMDAYKSVCFYVISTVSSLNTGRAAPRFATRGRAGLVLRTGHNYLIRVYQVIGDRSVPARPGFKMRLQCIEGQVSPLHSEISVDGAYDRLSFFAFVVPQEREKNQSELLLTCDQSIPDPSDPLLSSPIPPTPVQLLIKWPRWDRFVKWVVNPALFVLGAGLFVMADKVRQCLELGDNGKYLIQLVGLALLAIGGKTWGFLTGSIKSGPPGSRA
jgi:hypothetical protein